MKFFLMILATMALAGCSFGYTPPSKTSDKAGDTLADSRDSIDNDGEAGEEVEFNPPLTESDSGPLPIDTGPEGSDEETVGPDTDTVADEVSETVDTTDTETNPPVDTADTDGSGDAPDVPADGDSNGVDSDNIVEPGADAIDAQDTPDAEAETSVPCIPNCTNKQCGNDGCDGSCGSCPDNLTCNANFVCECTVGCQVPIEPTTDAADSDAGMDADANTATTADTKADSTPPPDETGGPTAETTDTADATIDTPQGETNPSVDALVNAELSADTNVAEVAAEITNKDTAMAEVTPNADTAAETGEDASEPDTFVQPCLAESALCDDSNACTDDWCDTASGCVHTNNAVACDDGNQCTTNDGCANSVCAPGMPVVCNDSDDCTDDYCQNGIGCVYEWICECASDVQCDDLNPCTDDSCASGFCEYAFNSIACDNNDACTITDQCVGGECLGIAPLSCNDGNECTIDTCNPTTGCQHEPQTGMACNDDNACTTADACDKDVCVGKAITCNDQNPCTDDSCDKQSGCVYTSNNANPCEDGSLCTVGDFCDAGECQGGNALKCDDKNICTDDVCQPQKGCVYPANQVGCDDGNSCTVGDICADMACASGTNICQCQNDADCDKADDENLCNGAIICDQSAMPFKCDTDPATIVICDANQDTACLKNTCVPDTGDCQMKAVNQGGGCDDGNACTFNDQCADGSCAGQSVKCDDSNVCTDDSCAQSSGCVFTPNSADCDDGSVCTMLDVCQGGQCVGTAPLDCDDSKDCTLDICHKALGCQHSKTAMNGQACNNGDACTVNDTCQNGACQAGKQTCECYVTADCAVKEDGNFCNGTLICDTSQMPHLCVLDPTTIITCPTTSDTACLINTCQPASGKCEMETVNEGGECDDGNPCTESDVCDKGVCLGESKPSGTVIFEDNFNDGNLDGWQIAGDNQSVYCGGNPDFLITDEPPRVKIYPLCPNGYGALTSPKTFFPSGANIQFAFRVANPNCQAPQYPAPVCHVFINGYDLGAINNSQPPCPIEEIKTFAVSTETEGYGSVILSCSQGAPGMISSYSAVYFGEFKLTCP